MPRPRKEGSPVRRLTIALPESLEAAVLAVNQATAVPVSRMLDLIREDLEIRLCECDKPGRCGPPDDERAAIANLIAMIEADDIARREEAKKKLGLGPRRVEGDEDQRGTYIYEPAAPSPILRGAEITYTPPSPRLAHMFEDDVEPATVEDPVGNYSIVVEPTEDELAPVVQLERREVER